MSPSFKKSKGTKPLAESFRVPIDCTVDLRLGPGDEWKRLSATNISMSGMFIRAAEMHPKGTALEVRFELQDSQSEIRAQVEVLWGRARDAGPHLQRGLGVRFIDLDLESKYAISSLVDRYQQLGRTPFQLSVAKDESHLSARTRQRVALALAFLAGAATGALGIGWFIGGKAGPTVSVAQAAAPVTPGSAPPKTVSAPARATAERAATEPVQAEPVQAEPESSLQDSDLVMAVEAAVEEWARAWQAKNVEQYLGCYADAFQPASGLTREAWMTQRRDRLARPGTIEVRLSALEVEFLAADRALVRFDQDYAAPGYRDRVRKQLELIWWARQWKIQHEETLADLPAG